MGIREFFGDKGTAPNVQPTAEELALAPFIAAARGIVSPTEAQRADNVQAVCDELTHSRYVRAQYMGA